MNVSTAEGKPHRIYYGWVIVATVGLASFSQAAGFFPVLGVLLNPITAEFGWSRTVFTAATTLGTLAGAAAALFVGGFVDRVGGRWLLTAALFLLGLTYVLMAFMQDLWQFYALQIFGRMLTMGVLSLALRVIIPKWFIARRGIAVAMGGMGGMLGNTLTPLYVQWVVGMSGWRTGTFVAGAAIWAVSVLPVALFLRRQPEDMGLLPDGAREQIPVPSSDESSAVSIVEEVSYSLREVLRQPTFYWLIAAFSILSIVGPGITLHMIPYLTDKGLSNGQAVSVLAGWSACGALGAFACGMLIRRLGSRVLLVIGLGMMSGGLFWLLTVSSFTQGLLWALYMGTVTGGIFNTVYQVIFADYYGRASLGRISSATWPVQLVGNASGPLVAALAYDATGSYTSIFTAFGFLLMASTVCAFLAKPPGPRGTVDLVSDTM